MQTQLKYVACPANMIPTVPAGWCYVAHSHSLWGHVLIMQSKEVPEKFKCELQTMEHYITLFLEASLDTELADIVAAFADRCKTVALKQAENDLSDAAYTN